MERNKFWMILKENLLAVQKVGLLCGPIRLWNRLVQFPRVRIPSPPTPHPDPLQLQAWVETYLSEGYQLFYAEAKGVHRGFRASASDTPAAPRRNIPDRASFQSLPLTSFLAKVNFLDFWAFHASSGRFDRGWRERTDEWWHVSSAATSLLPCRWPGETCHREAGVTCPRLEPWPSTSLPPPRLQQSQTHNNKANTVALHSELSAIRSKRASVRSRPAASGCAKQVVTFHDHMHKSKRDGAAHLPPHTQGHATVLERHGHLSQWLS